jgi:Protein of unknown function (DUF2939)
MTSYSFRRLAAVSIVLVVVVAGAWAYASPYLVLNRLKHAADVRDAETINQYVDYPALRVSLKQQLAARLARAVGARADNSPLTQIITGVSTMIGSALIAPVVDVYATPDGVAALLNGLPPRDVANDATPPGPVRAPGATAPASPATSAQTAGGNPGASGPGGQSRAEPQATAGYRGIDEFVVTYRRGANNAPYSAIFHRSGAFSWRLVAVDLSQE